MKIANHSNLERLHMYITLKNKNKKKEFFLTTSNLMKWKLNNLHAPDRYVAVDCKNTRSDSPFDVRTFVQCNEVYLLERVIITNAALTNPDKVPDDVLDLVWDLYKSCDINKVINANLVCKYNKIGFSKC